MRRGRGYPNKLTSKAEIKICLSCPEPTGCIANDFGCIHINKVKCSQQYKIWRSKKLAEIEKLLEEYTDKNLTSLILRRRTGLTRSQLENFKRGGHIETIKVADQSRYKLRIVGVNNV